MFKRKGVHIPMFMKLTWEFMPSTAGGGVRARPVFMLTEQFIRSLRVTNFKKPTLPPSTAACEEMNFSSLALKYSETLTKDVVFLSLRDLVRKIGDHVSCSHTLAIEMSVGTLKAKQRKVWFEFDQNSLRPSDAAATADMSVLPPVASAGPATDAAAAATSAAEDDAGVSAATMMMMATLAAEDAAVERGEGEAGEADDSAVVPALWDTAEAPPLNPDLAPDGDTGAVLSGPQFDPFAALDGGVAMGATLNKAMSTGTEGNVVLQEAYLRHITELEAEALRQAAENETIAERQLSLDDENANRNGNHREQLKEMQAFIKEQMAAAEAAKAEAAKEAHAAVEGGDNQGPLGGIGGGGPDTPGPGEELEPLTPRSAEVQRMRKHIAGKIKGKPSKRIDNKQLLKSLQRQMADKESRDAVQREAELSEEKRFLDHINMEMDLQVSLSPSLNSSLEVGLEEGKRLGPLLREGKACD